MLYFSATTRGFYDSKVHASIPDDAVEVTTEERAALLEGEALGHVIAVSPAGRPVLENPAPPAPPTREQIEAQRLRAYADPLIGSDRYFAEAQRESLLGNVEAAEAAKARGLARFAEIQAEYPWPVE